MPFDFSYALTLIRAGGVVTRKMWEGTGLTLGVMAPPADSGLTPFLAVRATNGQLMPWTPNHQELFATDWIEVGGSGVAGHG